MDVSVDVLQQAAREAIDALGGPTAAARRLTELSGKECSRIRVSAWLRRGVAPKWAPWVEQATGTPRHVLRPDYFATPPVERSAAQ